MKKIFTLLLLGIYSSFLFTEAFGQCPTVNIDAMVIYCANPAQIPLSGSVTDAPGRKWTTNGTGSFSDDEALNTVYFPSTEDYLNTVKFTLSAIGGSCEASAEHSLTFANPIVNAGSEATICANSYFVPNASSNTSKVYWTTNGGGIFSPSNEVLTPQYTPSFEDIIAGNVKLRLTGNIKGCLQIHEITLNISRTIYAADAGSDLFINPTNTIQLNGKLSKNGPFKWTTTGTGSFSPDDSSTLSPIYIPSQSDISTIVTITLEALDNNLCSSSNKDEMNIFFNTESLAKISGTVFSDNAASGAFVTLFKEQDGIYTFLDTVLTQTGDYTFKNLATGNYIVQARPQSLSNISFVPTYLGDVKEWSTSEIITLENLDITRNDIHLTPFTAAAGWNDGNENIEGIVTFKNIQLRSAVSSSATVYGATVYLMNLTGVEVSYAVTDKNGMFKFENVKTGIYFLRYEYPGVKQLFTRVLVDGNPETPSVGSAELERTSTIDGILKSNFAADVKAFPNPAYDFVHFDMDNDSPFEYIIINSTGTVVTNGHIENKEQNIFVENIKPGIYLVKLVQGNNIYKTKIYKQ